MKTYKNIRYVQVQNQPQTQILTKQGIWEAYPNELGKFDIKQGGSFFIVQDTVEAFIDLLIKKGMA